jgi:Bacterial PH domain
MKSMEDIIDSIKQQENAQQILSFYEVHDLPQILSEDEYIDYIASATMNNRKGLFALTDERVLFIYRDNGYTRFDQMNYEDITFIHPQRNSFYGEIEIYLKQNKVQIRDIAIYDLDEIMELFRIFIDDEQPSQPAKKGSFLGGFFKFIGIVTCIIFLIGFGVGFYEEMSVSDTDNADFEELSLDGLSPEEALKEYGIEAKNFVINKEKELIVGEITNTSDQLYRSAYINVHILDKEGNFLDNFLESTENFEPGETWEIEMYNYEEKADTLKVMEIIAYEPLEDE